MPSQSVNAFLSERQALETEMQALIVAGATADQLTRWYEENAAQFAAQVQRAQALAAASLSWSMPLISDVEIPDGASQTMSDFLVARANLSNAQVAAQPQQAGNRLAVAAVSPQAASSIQAQQQRAQALADEVAAQPQSVPSSLQIPGDATPQMRAFLIARDQLMRDQVACCNRNAAATPADRRTAMAQWSQFNAARFQALQQLTQNLSSSN